MIWKIYDIQILNRDLSIKFKKCKIKQIGIIIKKILKY